MAKVKQDCKSCNKEFYANQCDIKRGRGKFCSLRCSLSGNHNPRWKGGQAKGVCQICDKEFSTRQCNLKSGRAKFCSQNCLNKWRSNTIQKENHPNWQGGITPINFKIRNSLEYKKWRNIIFKRDRFTCQKCNNKQSGNLNAHHIHSFSKFPEMRFMECNGITLCQGCHENTYRKSVII